MTRRGCQKRDSRQRQGNDSDRNSPAAHCSNHRLSSLSEDPARGDTRRVERRNISSGGAYEPIMGYSRAVVAGGHVYVSGTAPAMPDGADPPKDAYSQTRRCFEIILAALAEAGARAEDVVRTRVYVTSAEVFPEVARAHAEVFSEIQPVNTTVIAQLIDPRWHVEIDVEAVLP